MYKVKLLKGAEKNLIETFNYISLDNPYYVKIVLDEIKKSVDYLKEYPFLGREIEDGVRQLVEAKYKFKIIYKVTGPIVSVIAIFKNKNSWE
ncbi:hypothetical protein AUK10_00885 [Candidatus Gracilibacteria bacterium CG2_30_37_12]|nr:MAG: hypothetical protein AUK10_00885 [Candidatus Gracilibacteria bacterium CG2_30_37_12]